MRLTDESFEFDDSGNSARMDLASCRCSRRVTTVISQGRTEWALIEDGCCIF